MKNLIPLVIATGLILALVAWQFIRPIEAVIENSFYQTKPGENNLLSFQSFRDSTVVISYTLYGDTITSNHLNRKEFNEVIRLIYPINTMERIQQLQLIPTPGD